MRLIRRTFTLLLLAMFISGLRVIVPLQHDGTAIAQTADPVFVGAGDITNCSGTRDESTAQLLDTIAGTVFTLGDNAYPDGTLTEFNNCYGPTWGRHKDRTRPVPGNHDYHTAGAAGYYTYFGTTASPLDTNCTSDCKGYYSYNLGAWHIIALNSEIDHTAGSPQETWLRADLAGNQSMCTLAYWHKPLFSSGANHGNNSSFQPFWQALYDYGADVVLNGHDHEYERFAPQSPTGQSAPTRGIREFVVGTGGAGLYSFTTPQPNSEVRNSTTFGVLKLTLHASSYDWQFVPVAGQTFTDAGSGNCVTTGATPTATRTPTPGPTATRTSTPTVTRTPTPGPSATPSRTPTTVASVVMTSQVIGSADDAEEAINTGSTNLTSSDLELGADGGTNQLVGMRFTNISIPRGASILNAYVEFEVDETGSDSTSVLIQGQASDNALAFSSSTNNISSRARTTAQVAWNNIPPWTVLNAKSQTPNISSIIQQIVSRPAWASGNSIVIIISGTGRRTAEAYDGEAPAAPKLVIQYATSATSTPGATATHTVTSTVTQTPTATRTQTPGPSATHTSTPTATRTPTPGPSITPTRTPSNTPNASDLIFADGFESGSFSAWSSASTGAGDLSVTALAALVGSNGMQVRINDTTAMYTVDDTPNAEPRYRARFYLDPNSISMTDGNSHYIFVGYDANSVFNTDFRFFGGSYQIRLRQQNDGQTTLSTAWVTISDAPHFIEMEWWAATAAGANDGGVRLWLDGVEVGSLSSLDNDTRRIEQVRFGVVSGIDAGTLGTYYLDALESRQQTYIGPAGSSPTPPALTVTPTLVLSATNTPSSTLTRTPTPTRTPTATVTIMHIGDLDRSSTLQNGGWTAIATITVHDANHNPVANATVSGTWSNGASGTASCTTASNGRCTLSMSNISKGQSSVTFTVNNVTRAASTYTSANNHDPDGESNGNSIVIARP